MPIQIFNSLTKKKEVFEPLQKGSVKIYTCGVTVYDRCHIGHARSLFVFDVVRRYLRYRGYDVKFVRNITDIDDKIINKANEINQDWKALVKDNIDAYYSDMDLLRIGRADIEPKATDNIPEMIAHIDGLIKKGMAYELDGDVYFSVRQFKSYGQLSGQSIDKMLEGVRIDANERKKDPLDFALWKRSKPGEPFWKSPWGEGRPGWHIECSCMSMKHLKTQTLDIHAGGRDLIFPHHENELAQSEGLTGKPFAKYWIHHGLLTINGQKMSKSLGNFITIEDVLKKNSVDDLKLLFLFSHYASPVDFTQEKINDAHKALNRFDVLFWRAYEALKNRNPETKGKDTAFVTQRKQEFLAAMDDDFNTPQALAALFDLINDTNKFMDEQANDQDYIPGLVSAIETLESLGREVFGLFLDEKQIELDENQKRLLDERAAARRDKQFKRSDELRDELKKQGVVVEDTKQGQVWRWA